MIEDNLHRIKAGVLPDDVEYIGQQGFMSATEILRLTRRTKAGAGVVDLCCGEGRTALHLARRLGRNVTGVDISSEAIANARYLKRLGEPGEGVPEKARVDFVRADILSERLPALLSFRRFDAALLFETALAFEDKAELFGRARRLIRPAGRLVLTAEVGEPLSAAEQAELPEPEDVHLADIGTYRSSLSSAGFGIVGEEDLTAAHALVARRIAEALREERARIAAVRADTEYEALVRRHRVWRRWLTPPSPRVRKVSFVAEPKSAYARRMPG